MFLLSRVVEKEVSSMFSNWVGAGMFSRVETKRSSVLSKVVEAEVPPMLSHVDGTYARFGFPEVSELEPLKNNTKIVECGFSPLLFDMFQIVS